jgi:hypothetical protein
MKPGNTLNADKLPPTQGMLHQAPAKLGPGAGRWANLHLVLGLTGGFIGSLILEFMRPPAWLLWQEVTTPLMLLALFALSTQLSLHYITVCAAHLRHEERDDVVLGRSLYSMLIFLLLPLYLPVALRRSLKYRAELRRAWVSYFSYGTFDVVNPGVLRDPGGSLLARAATFHVAIWVVSVRVLNLPAPGITEFQLRQIGWWLCPPLLLGPPLLVMLVASLVLSVNLGKLKEYRDD